MTDSSQPLADVIAFAFGVLIIWSIAAIQPMSSPRNRPRMFRGRRGEFVLFALTILTTLSIASALVWALLTMSWPKVIIIAVMALLFAPWSYRRLPFRLNGGATGLLLWDIALLVLNFVAWAPLRP